MGVTFTLVRVECRLCGATCQAYQTQPEKWATAWAALTCPDHTQEAQP